MTRNLYEDYVAGLVLDLREALVRHDENIKAHKLLTECVPYFLEHAKYDEIVQARDDQRRMVEHVLDPKVYERYYADNPHERPFEEQYGITPEVAADHLPRVEYLRLGLNRLTHKLAVPPGEIRVLDLAGNDGWMAVNLWKGAGVACDVVDLGKATTKRARQRLKDAGAPGFVHRGRADDLASLDGVFGNVYYEAVVAYEVIEHVRDPQELLAAMAGRVEIRGEIYVSTPNGAMELGEIPNWDHVEHKGHVRVYTPDTLKAELRAAGLQVLDTTVGADNVILTRSTRR